MVVRSVDGIVRTYVPDRVRPCSPDKCFSFCLACTQKKKRPTDWDSAVKNFDQSFKTTPDANIPAIQEDRVQKQQSVYDHKIDVDAEEGPLTFFSVADLSSDDYLAVEGGVYHL